MTRQEKMLALQVAIAAIFTAAKTAERELTAEEYATVQTNSAEFAGLKKTLEAEREAAAMNFGSLLNSPQGPRGQNQNAGDVTIAERAAFNTYLRTGNRDQYAADLAKLGRENFVITTGTDSGSAVPTSIQTPIIVRRAWNPWLNAAAIAGQPVMSLGSTETTTFPVMDDSTAGQVTDEDASTSTEADPSQTHITLGASLFDSKPVWISNTMAQANKFDLAAYLMPILDKRIELIQGSTWTTKALTYAAAHNSSAAVNGITYAQFVTWYHSLAPQFRTDGIFVVSDGLLTVLESLTDSVGRPLLTDPLITGAVKTLRGCPVVIDINLATPAANAYSGLFISGASIFPRVENNRRVAVYQRIPTFPDQQGYEVFVNGDFDIAPGYSFLRHAGS